MPLHLKVKVSHLAYFCFEMFSGSESEVGSSRINEPFSHRSADLHKLQIQLVSYLAIDPSKSKLVTDTSRSKLSDSKADTK